MASSVLPQPAPPQTRVAVRGNPPAVMSSKPSIPVATFASPGEVGGVSIEGEVLAGIVAV